MKNQQSILSRHRLPRFYRLSLVAGWTALPLLLCMGALLGSGLTISLIDPRFLLPLLFMLLPAIYVWREGIDVLPEGIITRIHLPRYHSYQQLDNWYFDNRPNRHTLTIWNITNHKVVECRAGHLSDLPHLLAALKSNLRPRNWPY